MNETHWIPGLTVLGAGVFTGVLFVLFSRTRAPGAPSTRELEADADAADLDQRYRQLIGQLKELSADRHLHSEEAYQQRRQGLELQAAEVLRAKEKGTRSQRHEAEKAAARAERRQQAAEAAKQTFFGRNPSLKGALVGGGLVLFFGLLGLLLSQESKERTEGVEMTGKNPNEGARPPMQRAPDDDPTLRAVMDRLNRTPDDVEAIAAASHALIQRQAFSEASSLVNRALGVDPFHVETRIHRAVLEAVTGDGQVAARELEHLASSYPQTHEAVLFAGVVRMEQGDKAAALKHFERYVAEAPPSEQPPMLRQGIEQLRQEMGAHP